MLSKINASPLIFGSILLWVFLTYWFFHPIYSKNFSEFHNVPLAVFMISACVALYYISKHGLVKWTGWKVLIFFWIMQLFSLLIYNSTHKSLLDISSGDILRFMFYALMVYSAVLIIFLFHYLLGYQVLKAVRIPERNIWLTLTIGICIAGLFYLFLAQSVGLTLWSVGIVLIPWVFVQYKRLLSIFREFLISPLTSGTNPEPVNLISVLGIGLFLTLGLIRSIKLFPLGFDGASHYMNIAHLIAGAGKLPEGFEAFNWSVFMSLGEILSGMESISIGLSHMTILPLIGYIAYFSREIFGIRSYWLPVWIWLVIPAVGYHIIIDEKVDLGFLLIAMGIMDFSRIIHQEIEGGQNDGKSVYRMVLLLGLLIGYAIGIKYLGVFLYVGVLAYFGAILLGRSTLYGVLGVFTGFIFYSGLFQKAYIDLDYQLGKYLGGALMIMSALFSAFYLYRHGNKSNFTKFIIINALLIGGVFISHGFWIFKNIKETGGFDLSTVMTGVPKSSLLSYVQPEQKEVDNKMLLLKNLADAGIALDTDQLLKFDKLINSLETVTDIKDILIVRVLTAEQGDKLRAWESANREEIDIRKGILDKFTGYLKERGLELSSSQVAQITAKIQETDIQELLGMNRKIYLDEIRSYILSQILTEEQRQIVSGKVSDGKQTDSRLTSAEYEEIRRYLGYEKGLIPYLTLPFNLTMNTNVPEARFVDIGFLYLFILLVMGLFLKTWWRYAYIILFLLLMAFSIWSHYQFDLSKGHVAGVHDYLDNYTEQSTGLLGILLGLFFYYINALLIFLGSTMSFSHVWLSSIDFPLILVILLLIAFFMNRVVQKVYAFNDLMLQSLWNFVYAYGVLWFVFGNGIVWYGFPFLLMIILFMVSFAEQLDLARIGWSEGKNFKLLFRMPVILIMVLFMSVPFSIYIGREDSNRSLIFTDAFIYNASKFHQKEETYNYFLPNMKESLELINRDKSAKVYRVGTFFNYHIYQNHRRVIEDNQLEKYSQMTEGLSSKEEFLNILYQQGVRFILFDLNIGSIDRTPEKSLINKANEFLQILFSAPNIVVRYTDNIVEDPNSEVVVGNNRIKGKTGFSGTTIQAGTYILFEITQ